MSVFRCMDEESTYRFFESCGWDSLAPDEVYVLVGKVGRYGGSVRIPISGCMETILRIDAPTPLKELLCAAIREGLSEYGAQKQGANKRPVSGTSLSQGRPRDCLTTRCLAHVWCV